MNGISRGLILEERAVDTLVRLMKRLNSIG
jgi:hypothetical protein